MFSCVKGVLAIRPADDIHQLGDFATLLRAITGGNGILDTMRDVIAQDFLFGAAQRRANGSDLRDDIDAVAILFNHAGEATDLPLDSLKPLET
jgi:hypothetical protein